MKEPVLDIAAEEIQESAAAGQARGASDRSSVEKRLTERMDARLEEIKKGIADGLTRMQERFNPVIDDRIKKALSGSFAALTNTTKEALTQVVQAILFDSGILERLVARIVDEKLGSGSRGSGTDGLSDSSRKEIQQLMQKEISAALASEQMKMVIDDKFRAISLYLKSDVIPKAVQDALKPKAPGGQGSGPGAGKTH